MGEVTIVVRPRTIERIIFIMVILVIGFLYVHCLVSNHGCEKNTTSINVSEEKDINGSVVNTTGQNTETDSVTDVPSIDETCYDGLKNQDEEGPDCGGICGNFWYDGKCHTTPKLNNGKASFSIYNLEKGTDYIFHNTTNAPKVLSLKIKIENGGDKDIVNGVIELYVRTKEGLLMMQPDDPEEPIVSYATINLSKISAGDTFDKRVSLDGKYTSASYIYDSRYDPGEGFKIEGVFIDGDNKEIGRVTKVVPAND